MASTEFDPANRLAKPAPAKPLRHGLWEAALFLVLLLAQLLPVWSFKYFPTQDGPSHLENARIIHDLIHPAGAPAAALEREYFRLNPRPVPNWLGHAILAALMCIVQPLTAEKILVSLYLLLLPLSARHALAAIRPRAGFLAILAIPLACNPTFQMGFYNFSFSMVLALLVIGYWIRHHRRFGPGRAAVLGLLATLLYFSHLFTWAITCLAIGLLMAWTLFQDRRDARPALVKRSLWTMAAFVPIALVAIWMVLPAIGHAERVEPAPAVSQSFVDTGAPPTPVEPHPSKLGHLVHRLTHFDTFASYDSSQVWMSTGILWAFIVIAAGSILAKLRLRHVTRWDGLLLVLAAFGIIYIKCQGGIWQQLYTEIRMQLTIFFVLLLWFGAQPFSKGVRIGIQAVGAFLAIAFLCSNFVHVARLNPYIAEYTSAADHMKRGSVFLPICFAPSGWDYVGHSLTPRTGIFTHAGDYLALEADSVSLHNYEAVRDYFPIEYQSAVNPSATLLERGYDFLAYPQLTPGRVDYVLLTGLRDDLRSTPAAAAILKRLAGAYDLVYESPHKMVQLYKRKD